MLFVESVGLTFGRPEVARAMKSTHPLYVALWILAEQNVVLALGSWVMILEIRKEGLDEIGRAMGLGRGGINGNSHKMELSAARKPERILCKKGSSVVSMTMIHWIIGASNQTI